MSLVVSSCAILIYLLSAYGWGRLATSRIYPDSRLGAASTAVCGMGVWIFIGGLLNVARLAYPITLDAILGLGLVFTIAFAISFFRANHITSVRELAECLRSAPAARESRLSGSLYGAAIGAIFLFLAMTQAPAAAFNLFDDFHTYLPRPVRMLQTGSLGGNPFDVLGIDSLGAQAFMQSFFVSRLSISHVNAFDAVGCFVLALCLLLEMSRRFRIHWTFLLASVVAFIAINPQYVNVSSLYSGSLMILAMVFVSVVVVDDMGGADRKRAIAGAAALALVTTSLVSLKTTFGVFAAVYLAVYLGCALYLSEDRRRMARSIVVAMLAAFALIAPWILLSLPNYVAALGVRLAARAPAAAGGYVADMEFLSRVVSVFSLAKSSWGGNYLTYSLLVTLLVLAGVVSAARFTRSRNIAERRLLAAILAACIAATVSYLFNVYHFDPENGVRYSIPILVATAAVTALLAGGGRSSQSRGGVDRSVARVGGIAALAAAAAIGSAFLDDLIDRMQGAYRYRTLLSFPAAASEEYRAYMAASLGEPAASRVHDLQHAVDAGSAILAFVRTPFHFDFARNQVFNATDSTVLNPWLADFLLDADPERARRYLRGRGVRYVMIEHDVFGVRPDWEFEKYVRLPFWMVRQTGERNLVLRKILRHLANRSRLLVANSEVVVFDIGKIPGSSD